MKNMVIRREEEKDYYQTELINQRAFWNKYVPGCDEHYLVHKLRMDDDFLPEFSRVAELDGKVVGCIMYAKGMVKDGDQIHPAVTFGPLCVDPDYQCRGIGAALVRETAALVKSAGYPGIIIMGEPDYYPRLGFKTCDHYGITAMGGKNFPAFMAYELSAGSLAGITGEYVEAGVYHNLPEPEVDEYNNKFPALEKLVLPGQGYAGGPE